MAKRTKQKPTGDIWADAAEVPREGGPDSDAIAKRYRKVRRYFAWSGALLPFVLALAVFAWGNVIMAEPPTVAPVVETAPPTRNLAMSAVQSWLDKDPSPLPGATLLSWDEHVDLPKRPRTSGGGSTGEADTIDRESHTLTVRTATGSLLTVQVLVAIEPNGQFAVIGEPSISAQLPPSTALVSADAWSAGDGDTATAAVTQAVEQWAAAFGSGDSVRLRQVVGDPDTTHVYVPLAGLTNPKVNITKVAWRTNIVDGRQERTEYLMVQAVVDLAWDGLEREQGATVPSATYDLLIVGADGGAPRVVAWGGPGTAPSLEPYGNAISGITESSETAVNPVGKDR